MSCVWHNHVAVRTLHNYRSIVRLHAAQNITNFLRNHRIEIGGTGVALLRRARDFEPFYSHGQIKQLFYGQQTEKCHKKKIA